MARLPRYVIPCQPQHIIQRGNNREVIFSANADYQFFRDALVEAAKKHGLAIHAYVWMSNHIHLLATPEFDRSISKVPQSVGRRYEEAGVRSFLLPNSALHPSGARKVVCFFKFPVERGRVNLSTGPQKFR